MIVEETLRLFERLYIALGARSAIVIFILF